MRLYYRIVLGSANSLATRAIAEGFVGLDYGISSDLSGHLPETWKAFNAEYIPVFLSVHPEKSRIAAGLACGALWTVAKGLQEDDVVLTADGHGRYRLGRISGPYQYVPDGPLRHRRPVRWSERPVDPADMSEELRRSVGARGAMSTLQQFGPDLERLLANPASPGPDGPIEDPAAFVMEKHLEDFLIENWAGTELGLEYDIYEEDGQPAGQQLLTDTGPLDILAVSKDRTTLLVVELKKGRASDAVVGQTLRYMGYVQSELAEPGQQVRGVIIALEDDQRIRRALSMIPAIAFYRYQVTFRLSKA